MNSKKFLAFAMAAAMTLSMTACGGSGSGAASSGTDSAAGTAFKLGGTGPLTGGASIYGLAAQRGAQIAVDEINAQGGAIQFDLKYEDDQHDPEKAVNAYNALKEWGMQISLGSVTSQPGISTSALSQEDGIFALTPSASSPDVIAGKDNVYQMCFSDPNQGLASAQYIAEQQLGEKIFIIWKSDDNYSTGIKDKFMAEADKLGLNVVGNATFTTDSQNDFNVQLTQAKQAEADLLFLPIYYEPASLILSQAKAMGYAPTFFGVDGMDGILTMEGFDPSLAEGLMLLTPFSATVPETQSFVEAYTAANDGVTPNQFAADAYDGVYIVKEALEKAGCTADMSSADICEALVAQMTQISYSGLTGKDMTWNAEGQVSKAPTAYVIKGGEYVLPEA